MAALSGHSGVVADGDQPARASGFDEVVAAMRRPGFFPHDPGVAELRETAISVVALAGERAYKIKKPVRLPFLDYAEPARRRALCLEEVRLNRRLAPDTYLGVRAIVRDDGGLALAADPREDAVEWAVEMQRLPERQTLAALLDAGRLTSADVHAVGRRLAAFHATAEIASEPAGPGAVKRPIDENFQPLLDLELTASERRRIAAAERFFDAFIVGRRDRLADRAACGRVRDGHGDLRLEHVLLLEGEQVIAYDCVEFDPALRRIDVAADLAFLVMELVARGADPLARELLAAYRGEGGDPGDDALVGFYAAYRAWVRAKLAYLAGEHPATLIAVAERFRWRARGPLILAFCGITASGKSTVADALAAGSAWRVLDSDRVRKQLAGVPPTDHAPAQYYTAAANRRTYRELGARAAVCVRRSGGVIVDATFRRLEDRRAFATGLGDRSAPVLFVECRAPREVLVERAREREHHAQRLSDATSDMVDRQLGEWEPLDETPAVAHLTVRTDRDPAEIADELEALLDRRLIGGEPAP